MIYFVTIPILVLLIFFIYKLRAIKKHDKVLFYFCDVRRASISLLRESNNISIEDYKQLKQIINCLNLSIHNYNEYKHTIFNIRNLSKFYGKLENDTKILYHLENFKNPEVVNIYRDFGFGLLNAFFTFTPLIKSTIVLKIFIFCLKNIPKFGKKVLNNLIYIDKTEIYLKNPAYN